MNYSACLEYLYSKLPMFSRMGPAALKPDLTNTLRICQFLNHPETTFPSIHIAGTNGKGSVSHMLASILQESGYKTGLYTSPHLRDFRERIRINGCMIPEDDVVRFTSQLMPLIENISPSFFEVTVGMAFQHFALEQVDVAVIETGLGGRLDSTNVIDPQLSVITNIGLDHVSLLGDTLDKIAYEKAGIIKKNRPVVVGRKQVETTPVFTDKANIQDAPIVYAEEDWLLNESTLSNSHLALEYTSRSTGKVVKLKSGLMGLYQSENARTVLSSIGVLNTLGWQILDESVERGMTNVKLNTGLEGRWDVIRRHPDLVMDVAHNPDGILQLLEQLKVHSHEHLYLIMGLSADKDCEKILDALPATATYGFTQAKIPRALPDKELSAMAHQKGLEGFVFENVNEAIQAFLHATQTNDLILVFGSVFVAGEVAVQKWSQ